MDLKVNAACAALTGKLVNLWQGYASDEWPWFEVSATYDNARLSQALILSGRWILYQDSLEVGLQSLRWLATIQKAPGGHFRPIGCNGFHEKNGVRAEFDQQPVECHAMVAACLDACRVTRDSYWSGEARRAFEWFLGRNDLGWRFTTRKPAVVVTDCIPTGSMRTRAPRHRSHFICLWRK